MFQGFENVFCCCTAEWKVGHTNIFSKTLVYLFPLPLSPTKKNSHTFSVSLVAKRLPTVDLNPCLATGLQLHLFQFSSEDFLDI